MAGTSIQFALDGIAHLLADRSLAVPVYQRSYAWNLEQVSEYWADVKGALDTDAAEYFMGTIVSAGGSDDSTVIDGQQRLATTTVLLAALRDAYQLRNDTARAQGIHDKYLARFDLASAQNEPRLTLNAEDRDFFLATVIDGIGMQPAISSHRRLQAAHDLLHRRLEEDLSTNHDNWQDRVLAWVNHLHYRVKVMVIDVPDIADGFVIFETLNDRGAPLTISDLVRNFLMSRAGDETGISAVQEAWTDALMNLGLQDEDSVFVDFLRQHWSSLYGAIREKDLFSEIRARARDRPSTLAVVEALPDAARNYAALLDSEHELWTQYPEQLQGAAEALLRLDLKQYRPLALAVLQRFEGSELIRTFRGLVSWAVRGLIVGGIGGGAAERAYGLAAVKVRSGDLASAEDVLRQLIPIVPNDRDFTTAFAHARVPRAHVARYLMTALERHSRDRQEPELVSDDFGRGLRLQYMLPKGATEEDWPDLEEEEVKTLVPRLGNAVLLSEDDGSLTGLRTFTERSAVVAESTVRLTRQVANHNSWDAQAIEERQRDLAARAIEVWPRTPVLEARDA